MRRIVAVTLLALAVVSACSGDGDSARTSPVSIGRDGSRPVVGATSVAIGAPLDGYSVTYRVERLLDGAVETSTVTLTVDRPFRSRLETRDDKRRITSLTVADFAYLGTRTGDDEDAAKVVTASPATAPNDVRADLLPGRGAAEVREVGGRRCEIHRFGAPLVGGTGELTEGDAVDVCIDADGLLLEQVVHDGSTISERWLATKVVVAVADGTSTSMVEDDDVLARVEPTPAAEGGGSVQEIDPASAPPSEFWQLDAPPAGFERKGRYAVVPPQEARTDDETTRAQVLAGVVDVFVRGPDVLIIDQGGTLGGVPPFGVHAGSRSVDLGELARSAEVFATPTGNEVRALLPPGHYVKVLGTLPADDLVAVARQLHPITGTGITYR